MEINELKLTVKRLEMVNILNLDNSDDILNYYPFRYEILNLRPIDKWQPKDKVIFSGRVIKAASNFGYNRNKTITNFSVETDSQILKVVLFNRYWAKNQILLGKDIVIIGIYDGNNKVTCTNYNFEDINQQLGIKPIYSLKENIKQNSLRKLIEYTYKVTQNTIEEEIPEFYRKKYKLITKKQAIKYIHNPIDEASLKQAIRYLKYSELLKFNLSLILSRSINIDNLIKTPRIVDQKLIEKVINSLPYELTSDQKVTIKSVLTDMQSNKIMYRLILGDVGCGKTIIAIIAMYASYLSHYQSCIMAPTQILAQQHYESIKEVLQKVGVKVELLNGSLNIKEKANIITALKNNEIDIIVGTHSLISDEIEFANLGLIVADEQQRFGVKQRQLLKEKGNKSDFLIMSATPIPRTLASCLYGEMDVSEIKSKPKNRLEVKTFLIKENSIRTIMDEIKNTLICNQQIYIVCAAIEENENYHARNVKDIYLNLKNYFKDKYDVAFLHGGLKNSEKNEVMQAFKNNNFQILVSTTVIEVGVSVKNATMIIIYDADRYGLSQIHQLRGRVQRGSKQGVCYLLTSSKQDEVLERLELLKSESDGFKIAAYDLKIRGPGELMGYKQAGKANLLIANIIDDEVILKVSNQDAKEILANADDLENKKLISKVVAYNKDNLNYID